MRKIKFVEKTVREVEDVICDRCGNSCVARFNQGISITETLSIKAAWGYGSGLDGEEWAGEICESCAKELKNWVNQGKGPGLRVKDHMGWAAPEKEELMRLLNHTANEEAGMDGEAFLDAFQRGETLPDDCRQSAWLAEVILAPAES